MDDYMTAAGFNAEWRRAGNSLIITILDMNATFGRGPRSTRVANLTDTIGGVQFTLNGYIPDKDMNANNGHNTDWSINGNQILITIEDLNADHGVNNKGTTKVAWMQQSIGDKVFQLSAYRWEAYDDEDEDDGMPICPSCDSSEDVEGPDEDGDYQCTDDDCPDVYFK